MILWPAGKVIRFRVESIFFCRGSGVTRKRVVRIRKRRSGLEIFGFLRVNSFTDVNCGPPDRQRQTVTCVFVKFRLSKDFSEDSNDEDSDRLRVSELICRLVLM